MTSPEADAPFTLTVLGATGRTGRFVVEEALARGWRVRVLVRNRALVPHGWKLEGIVLVEGDATDAAAVTRAVHGADAVVSTIGHAPRSPLDVLEASARAVLTAMRAGGVDRLVVLTRANAIAPGPRSGFKAAVTRALQGREDAAVAEDAARQADVVRASDLAWTLVRTSRLRDKPATGRVNVDATRPDARGHVTRADVARFIVDEVRAREHVHAAPVVTNE